MKKISFTITFNRKEVIKLLFGCIKSLLTSKGELTISFDNANVNDEDLTIDESLMLEMLYKNYGDNV